MIITYKYNDLFIVINVYFMQVNHVRCCMFRIHNLKSVYKCLLRVAGNAVQKVTNQLLFVKYKKKGDNFMCWNSLYTYTLWQTRPVIDCYCNLQLGQRAWPVIIYSVNCLVQRAWTIIKLFTGRFFILFLWCIVLIKPKVVHEWFLFLIMFLQY